MKTLIRTCAAIGALLATTAIHASGQAPATTPRRLEIVAKGSLPKPPAPRDARTAYLMSFFTDEDHSLHFATSRDGYSFTDVNGGQPVMLGRDVAEQKGIRDPHIMRGPDGGFYMSMTDLHIFAKREGMRDTEWERPDARYGWGNNRNMIFMKSYDLIHWTQARVTPSALFPRYRDAGNMWAPETIYDPQRKALMVYFTTRDGNGPNYLVFSYADKDFTTLTEEPKKLFDYPDPKVNVIDADITRVGDKYHMFYVAHQAPGNIRHSESSRINSGWTKDLRKVDPETAASEAPTLWRRNGTNTYVLMYDVFGIKPNNMGFSETTDFVTYRNIGRFNEPGSPMKATNFTRPKHGAVIAISPAEATRLERYFAAR